MYGKRKKLDAVDISSLPARSELDVFTDRIKRDLIKYAIPDLMPLTTSSPSMRDLRAILFEKSKECPSGKNLSGKSALEGPKGIIAIIREKITVQENGLEHDFYKAILHDYEVMIGKATLDKVKPTLDTFEAKAKKIISRKIKI